MNTAARVCVVGNAAIDLSVQVNALPLPGETVLAVESRSDFGGKGANQAVVAARAGAETQLFAALGCEADGDRILARLIDDGVNTQNVVRLSCASDLSIVTVDARGENTIVTRNTAAADYRPNLHTLLDATHAGAWIVQPGNLGAPVTAEGLDTECGASALRLPTDARPCRHSCRQSGRSCRTDRTRHPGACCRSAARRRRARGTDHAWRAGCSLVRRAWGKAGCGSARPGHRYRWRWRRFLRPARRCAGTKSDHAHCAALGIVSCRIERDAARQPSQLSRSRNHARFTKRISRR